MRNENNASAKLVVNIKLLFIIINETRIIIIIIYFAFLIYMILIFVYTLMGSFSPFSINCLHVYILQQVYRCLSELRVFNVVILGQMISYFIYKTSMEIMNKNIQERNRKINEPGLLLLLLFIIHCYFCFPSCVSLNCATDVLCRQSNRTHTQLTFLFLVSYLIYPLN